MPFIRSLLTKLFLLLCVVRQSTAQDGSYNITVVDMVKDIRSGSAWSSLNYLTPVNGTLYFQADNGTKGFELWKSDGTEAGTVMVKDINLGSSNGSPSSLTPFNGTQYFSASDGMNGKELWKTDNILHYYSSSSVIACC